MPHDAPLQLSIWQRLASPECAELVRRASEAGASGRSHEPATISALRRLIDDPDLVHAAFQLAEARRKGVIKFADRINTIIADPQGMEMASSLLIARYKARRFVAHASSSGSRTPVLDLCAGIGGDAMGLRDAGLDVIAIDRDPTRAWMASVNAHCASRACDALDSALPEGPFHIDPSRRKEHAGGKRVFRLDEHEPGPSQIRSLIARRGAFGGAIKLGPGVDHSELLSLGSGEQEFISEASGSSGGGVRLTQAVLWTGPMAGDAPRRATLVREGHKPATIAGEPDTGPTPRVSSIDAIASHIYEIDASVERARLLHTLCALTGTPMLHPQLGLLTSDHAISHPLLTPFKVHAHMPWNERRVIEWLRAHDSGIVEVKTRGQVVDPDKYQRRMRGPGTKPFAVFVLRADRELVALITSRGD